MLIAKNKAISWLLISAFEISAFWILLSSPEFSSGFIAVLSALFMLYNFAFVHSAQGQLMKKPLNDENGEQKRTAEKKRYSPKEL